MKIFCPTRPLPITAKINRIVVLFLSQYFSKTRPARQAEQVRLTAKEKQSAPAGERPALYNTFFRRGAPCGARLSFCPRRRSVTAYPGAPPARPGPAFRGRGPAPSAGRPPAGRRPGAARHCPESVGGRPAAQTARWPPRSPAG